MSLNPDDAPAEYYSQAGATAYLIDLAGTYSPAGANAPTTDPAGTDDGAGASAQTLAAGAYVPTTGATPVAADIVDFAGAYTLAGSATADPAGTDGGAGGPTLPAPGAYTPITGATSDPDGAYSPAGSGAPTTEFAGRAGSVGASAPTLVAAGAYIPITEAASTAAAIVDPASTYGAAGALPGAVSSGAPRYGANVANLTPALSPAQNSAPSTKSQSANDPPSANLAASPGVSNASASLATSDAPSIKPHGAPPGYYYDAATDSYVIDPAGTYSTGGATAPTEDPGGTYSGAGASAPSADPEGTYSAAGASAASTDPAGTYSGPYALNRLYVVWQRIAPATSVLTFNSATAVANYFGTKGPLSGLTSLADDFFAGYAGTSATISFTRFGLGQRPHLLGANISDLTLAQLQSINGSLALNFNGYIYSGQVNLSGVLGFSDVSSTIQTALNDNLQVAAMTAGSSIAPKSVSFMGYLKNAQLYITSISSGTIEIGGIISGPGITSPGYFAQIINQLSGTPGGPGQYSTFARAGSVPTTELMTETYGVLTVGTVNSGAVAVGQEVAGADVLPLTAIDGNLSGSGAGSTWIVNNAQKVAGDVTTTAPPLTVALSYGNKPIKGATENNDFINVDPNSEFGFDQDPSSITYMSGTAAAALGLTQASGAVDSSPGGQHDTTAQYMNNIVQNETNQFGSEANQFGSIETNIPRAAPALAAWAQSNADDGYQFIHSTSNTTGPPAGASAPTRDPAGTFSGRRSKRAYAGGGGDLYTGHRGEIFHGGNHRPCRHL